MEVCLKGSAAREGGFALQKTEPFYKNALENYVKWLLYRTDKVDLTLQLVKKKKKDWQGITQVCQGPTAHQGIKDSSPPRAGTGGWGIKWNYEVAGSKRNKERSFFKQLWKLQSQDAADAKFTEIQNLHCRLLNTNVHKTIPLFAEEVFSCEPVRWELGE